jgi:hypothetical protein
VKFNGFFRNAKLIGLFYFFQYFPMLGEAVFLSLGKNQFVVGHDLKNTAAGFDEFCLHPQFFLDGLCQTGSLGIVVSLVAVFDRNALNHNPSLS